jgi:hypothetical protein
MAFEMAFETLTTNEAAFVAGVSVDDVNRVIDRKILPESLYETSPVRTLKRGACVFIAFWLANRSLQRLGSGSSLVR